MKTTRNIIAALLLLLVWGGGSGGAKADAERDTIITQVAKVSTSVGALYAQEEQGDIKFLCTISAVGEEAGKTIGLTANHCLQKGVAYLANFGDNQLRPSTAWKIPHYVVDDKKYPRRYDEPETDMALFLISGPKIPALALSTQPKPPVGTRVLMVGFPLGVAKIAYEGSLAGYFDRPGSDVSGYLLLQIFGNAGSSGSAVINAETGQVVGILAAATSSGFGLPVIFAVPIGYQENLMPVRPNGKEK